MQPMWLSACAVQVYGWTGQRGLSNDVTSLPPRGSVVLAHPERQVPKLLTGRTHPGSFFTSPPVYAQGLRIASSLTMMCVSIPRFPFFRHRSATAIWYACDGCFPMTGTEAMASRDLLLRLGARSFFCRARALASRLLRVRGAGRRGCATDVNSQDSWD